MANNSSQVLFVSSGNSDVNSGSIWDYNTGNSLKVYKGGGTARIHSFQQLSNDYFMIADQNKPLLHMWAVNKQEPVKDIRLVLPNPATALAISPDNGFLTVSIGTKLYTWEINTGLLLSIVENHLQTITCLKFAGFYLISASEGGNIVTYAHSDLISIHTGNVRQIEPKYARSDHCNTIVDLHVGCFGVRSRFVTACSDGTSIVYIALTGEPLIRLNINENLSCVLADKLFVNIFLGTEKGQIVQYNLHEAPRTFTNHVVADSNVCFIGHNKQVNCLDINITGDRLVSGSSDNIVYVWDICSKSILNTLDFVSAVTNVRFIWNHANIFAENFQSKYILKTLRRDIDNEEDNSIIIINHQYDIVM